MLNRAALIVRPAEPYLAWARSLDDSGVTPDPATEQTVYLIPEFDSLEEAGSLLPAIFVEVFERELFGWHTDEHQWPKDRSFGTFKKWFSIDMHTVVEDLCADPLEDDDE